MSGILFELARSSNNLSSDFRAFHSNSISMMICLSLLDIICRRIIFRWSHAFDNRVCLRHVRGRNNSLGHRLLTHLSM